MIEDAQVWTAEELRWLREGIIEECARVAEQWPDRYPSLTGVVIAAAIRALKSIPDGETGPSTSSAKPTSV